jgi:TP901 family phage tail tape measure protein
MSGPLTAAFRLTLQDEASPGVQSLDALFGRLNATLDRLAAALEPLTAMQERMARVTAGAVGLDQALSGSAAAATRAAEAGRVATSAIEGMGSVFGTAAWQVSELTVNLGTVGAAAVSAGTEGETMGEEIAAGARTATSTLDALLARMRAIRDAGVGAAGAMRDGPVGTYFGGIRDAGRGFSDSLQHSMHHGMTSAMATMALLEPIHAAAEYDNLATHIGITLGKNGDANTAFANNFKRQIDALARQTGQRGIDLMESASFLSMEGYSLGRILNFTPTVARIATAYNAAPDSVAKTAFTLQESLGIDEKSLPQGLAILARAGKEASLPLEELAPLFPSLGARAGQLGIKGVQGVADIGAILDVIRKNSGSSGQATAYFEEFMQTLTTKHGQQRFSKILGTDVIHLIATDSAAGRDPLLDIIGKISAVTDPEKRLRVVSGLFGNMQDQSAANAMLKDMGKFQDIRSRLGATTTGMTDNDYDTGLTSTKIRLQAFEEAIAQLNRRIGDGFVPTLNVLTHALNGVNAGWEWLDTHMPGVTSAMTGAMGATLGLTAAFTAMRAVGGPFVAAVRLLASPLRGLISLSRGLSVAMGLGRVATLAMGGVFVVAGAVAVAAIADIALHWDRFASLFAATGHGLMEELRGIGNFLAGVVTGDWDRALHGIGQALRGFGGAFSGEFGIVRQVFLDFAHWVDGWTAGLPSRILGGISAEWHVLTDGMTAHVHEMEGVVDNSWLGRHMGFAAPVPAPPAPVPMAVHAGAAAAGAQFGLHVTTERGVQVRQTSGPSQGLTIAQPNLGRMVGRP